MSKKQHLSFQEEQANWKRNWEGQAAFFDVAVEQQNSVSIQDSHETRLGRETKLEKENYFLLFFLLLLPFPPSPSILSKE